MGLMKNGLLLGAGYVIGAHAGRGRCEQIKRKASELLQSPRVGQATDRAMHAVGQRLALIDRDGTQRAEPAAGAAAKTAAQTAPQTVADDATEGVAATADVHRSPRRSWRRSRPTSSSVAADSTSAGMSPADVTAPGTASGPAVPSTAVDPGSSQR